MNRGRGRGISHKNTLNIHKQESRLNVNVTVAGSHTSRGQCPEIIVHHTRRKTTTSSESDRITDDFAAHLSIQGLCADIDIVKLSTNIFLIHRTVRG
jgi:hypothetical protein